MEEKRRRGRPRPESTIQRDAAVLEQLKRNGPLSRNQLAESLGLPVTIVYLSLDRLRREGTVRICADTAGPGAVWTAGVSCP